MKKLITTLVFIVVATLSTYAQKNGFYITPSLTFADFKNTAPSKTLVGEAGYFGSVLGLTGLVQSDRHWHQPQVGLKVYAELFTVENISIKGFVAVKGALKDYSDRPIEIEPGVAAFIPLVGRFGAKIAASALVHDNSDTYKPAANIGLTYRLF